MLSPFSVTLSNVVHFKLDHFEPIQLVCAGDVEWLHFIRQFPAVQTLHVSQRSSGYVPLALELLEDISTQMAAEVLPSLHLIFLEGQPTSSIEKFIAFRRFCGRPVTVVDTETDYERLIPHR